MDPTLLHLHHQHPALALGSVSPWGAVRQSEARLLALRHRLGIGLSRWGYKHRDGMRTVAARRIRGRMLRGGVDSCGEGMRRGPGVAVNHYAEATSFALGNQVTLHEQVQVKLEARGAQIAIGDRSWIAERTALIAHDHISIGADCAISWDVLIMDGDYHRLVSDTAQTAPIRIGDHVWIGARATVLKGVTVGDGAVLAAGAVVTADVPPRTMVAGVPARVVRRDVDWEN